MGEAEADMINERKAQAMLMHWAIRKKHHEFVIPNITYLFRVSCESDLVSVTRAGLVHEYEIKCTRADFLRDKNKRYKHQVYSRKNGLGPSYFWYVTTGFKVAADEIPDHAGWIELDGRISYRQHPWTVKRQAPRRHTRKLNPAQLRKIARGLSYRISDLYQINGGG